MDAMQRTDDAGRAAPLVLELGSGTARLHGEELELPLREFRLLAALAARVGEPIPSKALIEAVWPDAPWTSSNDLYTLVSKLRRLIDGPDKFGNNIRNRRGFGYLLDLKADQLVVIDPAPVDPTPLAIDLTEKVEEPSPEPVVAEPAEVGDDQPTPVVIARQSALRTAPVLALVAILLLAGSWGAGWVLSRRNSDRTDARTDARGSVVTQPEAPEKTEPKKARRGERKKGSKKPSRRKGRRNSGPAVIAAPGSTDAPSTTTGPAVGSTKGSRKGSEEKEPAPPPLPPAPTRYLYHLVNEKTGDHFVTTDGNTASEYEAKGYEGGAIGRIYSYQENGTRAITTDAGTAYVFIGSAPKTEPASRTLALWYSTNNNGDFFYTTSQSEATQTGWTGSRIGYVRSL